MIEAIMYPRRPVPDDKRRILVHQQHNQTGVVNMPINFIKQQVLASFHQCVNPPISQVSDNLQAAYCYVDTALHVHHNFGARSSRP